METLAAHSARATLLAGSHQVRLHSEFKKSSFFIGLNLAQDNGASKFEEYGTAFLIDYTQGAWTFKYLVTARHVAKQLDGSNFAIRANIKGRGAVAVVEEVPAEVGWYHAPEPDVDLSVALIHFGDNFDVVALDFRHHVTRERMESKRLEEGTPAYMTGLFRPFPGINRMAPIVHSGHIALIPSEGERFRTAHGDVSGILLQMPGLDGSSGSPVFVRRPVWVTPVPKPWEDTGAVPEAFGAVFLLGVWVSAWFGEPDALARPRPALANPMKVPVGFGVVVPAEKLASFLEGETLKKKRDDAIEFAEEQRAKGIDLEPMGVDRLPDAEARFEKTVKTMLATPPSPHQTKPRAKHTRAKKG